MSKFLESLVRSEAKSCAGKIQFPREDSAQRSAEDMMRKKGNGEVFEHYRCDFGDHWHIGHRTSFDWIPKSHKFQTAFIIKYECTCKNLFLTCTILSNRIMDHFPAILTAKESFNRCPKCKAMDATELGRKLVPLNDIAEDSTITIEELWEGTNGTTQNA
jgi:hypothetical protein